MAAHQIDFSKVAGYATYENALKVAETTRDAAIKYAGEHDAWRVRFSIQCHIYAGTNKKLVGQLRFVPVFHVNDFPGGPGFFLSLTNVCTCN